MKNFLLTLVIEGLEDKYSLLLSRGRENHSIEELLNCLFNSALGCGNNDHYYMHTHTFRVHCSEEEEVCWSSP